MALNSIRLIAVALSIVAASGTGAASGLSRATYLVERDPGDGIFTEVGTLDLGAMTPNLAGWNGTFTDKATGATDSVTGIDSAMVSDRSADYLALSIGPRVCLVEAVSPQTTPRTYAARCVATGENFAASYRLTETASEGISLAP